MGFYQSEVVKCLDTGAETIKMYKADGTVVELTQLVFQGLFKSVETPSDAGTAYDLHLQPSDTLTLTSDQVTQIQNAPTLEDAEAIIEKAIEDKVEGQAVGESAPSVETGEPTSTETTPSSPASQSAEGSDTLSPVEPSQPTNTAEGTAETLQSGDPLGEPIAPTAGENTGTEAMEVEGSAPVITE